MGKTKILAGEYSLLQEQYLTDIDCSGGIYMELQQRARKKLTVSVTNFGYFYKATLNGVSITKEKLFEIIGLEHQAKRLDFYLNEFSKRDDHSYDLDFYEFDVT